MHGWLESPGEGLILWALGEISFLPFSTPKAERALSGFPCSLQGSAGLSLLEKLEATQGELLSTLPFSCEYPYILFYHHAFTLHFHPLKGKDSFLC